MIKQVLGCVVVFGCLMASASLQAHHSTAGIYDPAKSGEITGTLSKLQFVNPHGSITITVKNADGTTTEWMIESGTPNTLVRRGFTKQSLLPGTEITVEGYRAKNGANRANGADLILADGKRLFLGSSGTGAPKDAPDGQ